MFHICANKFCKVHVGGGGDIAQPDTAQRAMPVTGDGLCNAIRVMVCIYLVWGKLLTQFLHCRYVFRYLLSTMRVNYYWDMIGAKM